MRLTIGVANFSATGRRKRFDAGLIVKLETSRIATRIASGGLWKEGSGDFDDTAREELRRFKRVFDNYKLSFIELRGIEVAEVCQIFERINQAGQPLSMFDIVVAKTFRPEGEEAPDSTSEACSKAFVMISIW